MAVEAQSLSGDSLVAVGAVYHRSRDRYRARKMSAVAIIPARGGSRRIPRKNIKRFCGVPMLAYPIAAAKASGLFKDVYVSTEDAEVARVATDYNAKVHARQPDFAEDGVGTQEVMRLALMELFSASSAPPPEYACCIYPCSPNLWPNDLSAAFTAVQGGSSYAVAEGIFYIGRTEWFLNHEPLERVIKLDLGQRHIDINVQADWDEARRIYLRNNR